MVASIWHVEPLRIRLFGGFLLEYEGKSLPPIPSRLGRSLLAYLVTHRDRAHTRDLLAGIFWPDMAESHARRRLSHALWQAQGVLAELPSPDPYMIATPNSLRFNGAAPYWLDVDEFERAVDGTDGGIETMAAAVDLYRGDFLAGFYEEWLFEEQERLRETYLSTLGRLVRLLKSHADYERALGYAKRMVMQNPLREDAHREVMRLCFLVGRSNEALLQYERCVSILDEEFGTLPSPATSALHREIQDAHQKGERPFTPAPSAPLFGPAREVGMVGRIDERAALLEVMEGALSGRGGAVLVEGQPGVGKTRLLRALSDDAQWRGLSPLWGTCNELDIRTPYAGIAEALQSGLSPLRAEQVSEVVDDVWLSTGGRVVPALADFLPDLATAPQLKAGEDRTRMHEALVRIVTAMGRISPHVMFVDDVQWADEDTLAVLRLLLGSVISNQIVLVLSYRGSEARERPEVWEALLEVDRAPGSERIVLADLPSLEVSKLIEQGMGWTGVAPEFVDSVLLQTGGNPLLVLETLRAFQEQQAEHSEIVEDDASLPLTPGVSEILQRRLRSLPPDTSTVLDVLAVYGKPLDSDGVAAIANTSKLLALSGLDDSLRRAILVEEMGSYRFTHEQLRRVAYDTLDHLDRSSLHRQVGGWMEDHEPQRIEELALHFTRGEEWERAFSSLVLAGERAVSVSAYETASYQFEDAIAISTAHGVGEAQLFETLSSQERVLDVLGRREAQADVIERMSALTAGDEARLSHVFRRKAWLLAETGDFEAATSSAHKAIELAEAAGEGSGPALRVMGQITAWRGRAADAVQWLEAAVEAEAGTSGEADARYALGSALAELQDAEASIQVTAAQGLYEVAGDDRGVAEALGLLGTIAASEGDHAAAEEAFRAALDTSHRMGYRHGEAANEGNLATLLFLAGRPLQALAHFDQAVDVCREIGFERGRFIALANAAFLRHRVLGEDDRAERDATDARDYFLKIGNERGEAICVDVLVGISARRGDIEGALRLGESTVHRLIALGDSWLVAQQLRTLGEIELRSGDPDQALLHAHNALAACEEAGLKDLAVSISALLARTLLATGSVREAAGYIESAVHGLLPSTEQSYLVHFARFEVLVALGRSSDAQVALEEAYQGLIRTLGGLNDEQPSGPLESVPEHAEIVSAWRSARPAVRAVSLRSASGTEMIDVLWTLDAPADAVAKNPVERRRIQIARLLDEAEQKGAVPTAKDLAAALDVSASTVRRDLAALRKQ